MKLEDTWTQATCTILLKAPIFSKIMVMMSYKVPTFQFFSWLSVAKARVRRAIQTGEDKVFRLFSEQNPTVGLGNKERDFRKIFVPFFARAILLHIQWSSSNKCDRKTILDDYWVEKLAGKFLRCPNRLAKGFTGTKNLFNTFLSSTKIEITNLLFDEKCNDKSETLLYLTAQLLKIVIRLQNPFGFP